MKEVRLKYFALSCTLHVICKPLDQLHQKRAREANSGQFLVVRTIDAQSKTLGQDLNYVFSKNVAKARRENKAVTGVVDRAPTKA